MKIAKTFLLWIFVSFLCGCAVTRIDVDVYKGPLSNDEDIQMAQLAVMATAAKPLLIELRNDLQWPWRVPKDYANQGWVGEATITKKDAMRVDIVLGLYEDRDRELGDFVPKATAVVSNYAANFGILMATNRSEDRSAWDQYANLMVMITVYRQLKWL
jgi:hypothetical protein